MATTRLSHSVLLSLALHGAILLGLIWVRIDAPPAEMPAGIDVVWVESGLPDLAGPSRGDAGLAETADSDPTGEPLPEAVLAEADDDRPAPENPDARDPVSGANRPAPTPSEPADEDRQRRADADATESDAAEAVEPPSEAVVEAVDEPAESVAEPVPGLAVATAARSQRVEPAASSTSSESPRPQSRDSALQRPSESLRPPRPSRPPPEPVMAEEAEMLREEVMDWINRSRNLPSQPSVAWSHDGHEYRAELTRVASAGAMGIEEALVEISTELNGRHLSTEMRLKRLAFSHYAQFIDRWDPNVQIHDDEIDGRFHSNSEIVIEDSGRVQPVFHGKVTTPQGIDTSRSTRRVRRTEVFLGGLDTRVRRIPLPRRFAPLDSLAANGAEVVALEADSRLTFFADGTYEVKALDRGRTRRGELGSSQTYFIAAEKTTVGVEGTVNGKVLVYSPREIIIEGDLVYAADPTRVPDANDYLGLVSDGNVEIATSEVTGPGDLTVHAAIYAKRRFAVNRYSGSGRATLFIYGSLTAGSLTATEPRYGTKLAFDTRLENARPPSFPITDRYELSSWDGVWRVGTD